MTSAQAIKAWCTDCVGSVRNVRNCCGERTLNGGDNGRGVCLFYRHRLGKGRPSVKLIRKMCLWCQNDQRSLVRDCIETDCPLYPYRMGSNPNYDSSMVLNTEKFAQSA